MKKHCKKDHGGSTSKTKLLQIEGKVVGFEVVNGAPKVQVVSINSILPIISIRPTTMELGVDCDIEKVKVEQMRVANDLVENNLSYLTLTQPLCRCEINNKNDESKIESSKYGEKF